MKKSIKQFIISILAFTISLSAHAYSKQCTRHEHLNHGATSRVIGEFRGILPCADCAGLDTRVKFTKYTPHASAGTYVMQETYLAKNVTLVTKGKWKTIIGNNHNPNATIYVLNPYRSKHPRYFLKVNDQAIQTLDQTMNEIPSPFNLTLRLQKIGMANPASVNCINHGGILEIRMNRTGGEYGVCHFPDGRLCEEWALFHNHACVMPKY
jgi:putative hemolysin